MNPEHPIMRAFGVGILLSTGIVCFSISGCKSEDQELRLNARAAFDQVHTIEQSVVNRILIDEKRLDTIETKLHIAKAEVKK